MCGILGSVGFDISGNINTMMKILTKRGPDGNGLYEDKKNLITLVHTRLSIIDLTEYGSQPMEYGDYIITYNGEIYNYAEIKVELINLGHSFRTNSDTEVILAAYSEWNSNCLTRFRGMFAFAIWDKRNSLLFAARDRFGIKPFYYYMSSENIIFSSLLTVLMSSGVVPKVLNKKGLALYLQTGSFSGLNTIISNVFQLLPAHYLIFENNKLSIFQYWDIKKRSVKKETENPTYKEVTQEIRKKLIEAAAYHLVSDVPVGAFLSGGIDTSIVVGLMSQLNDKRLETFTVGFEKKNSFLNEFKFADITAKKFNTNHHEIIISDRDITNILDELLEAIDQPSLDGTNTFFVSKATSQFCKVAVSGLGADEIFGGYSHYRYSKFALDYLPKGILYSSAFLKIANVLPEKYKELISFLLRQPSMRPELIRNYGKTHNVLQKISDYDKWDMINILRNYYGRFINSEMDPIKQMSYIEINTYLVDTLLRDGDALSMHNGLEVRPLFLDHILASFVFNVNPGFKIRNGRKKNLLIDASTDLLSPEIIKRKKAGFELPLTYWLSTILKKEYLSLLNENSIHIITDQYRSYLINSFNVGNIDNLHWAIFILLKYIKKHSLIVD